jgi:magnesium transporter
MPKKRTQSFFHSGRTKKSFQPPGTIENAHTLRQDNVVITVIEFNEQSITEKVLTDISECLAYKNTPLTTWINIDGIHNIKAVEKIGALFGIHPLTLEDIVNTDQRPKFEDYENYLVVVMKMLYYDIALHGEQLTIILMENLVITFQEIHGQDAFTPIRKRLHDGNGRVRRYGADYLCYALMDAIVDSYFNILEKIGNKIEDIDEILITNPSPNTIEILHDLKREMIHLRKAVWPVQDLLISFQRSETLLIKSTTDLYLRDISDHSVRVIETVENYRDLISSMMDVYLSSLSHKMNEVMKVLTIMSSIFIPVTFIAGVYGMNFDFMPELHSVYGYVITWIVMLTVMISLAIYFKRKKWL